MNGRTRTAKHRRLLWYGLAAGVLLLVVPLAAMRLVVYMAPEYRTQAETHLSDVLGQPVELAELRVTWRGLRPQVMLQQVRVGGGRGQILQELRLDLDPGRSLRAMRPIISGLEFVGLDLKVQRTPAGQFHLVGMEADWEQVPVLEAVNRLHENLRRHQLGLRLSDSRVRLLDQERRQTHLLDEVALRLRQRDDGAWQLAGQARLPEQWGRGVAIVLEWGKKGARPLQEDQIDLFADVRGLQPAAMEELLEARGQHVSRLTAAGDVRIWGTLNNGLPAADGIVDKEHYSGHFSLRADQGSFAIAPLFRSDIPYDRFAAEIGWQSNKTGWRLDVEEASIANADGQIISRGTIARSSQEPLFMDLRMKLRGAEGNVANASRYLPAGIMRGKLVEWLDRNLAGGTAKEAELLFFGHVADFPFKEGRGHFEVRAEIRDANLTYQPGWPGLSGLDGRLYFLNDSMRITANIGEVAGARLRHAEAVIQQFGQTPLVITGRVQGSGESMLGFLHDMPVTGDALERIVSSTRLDGEHDLFLDLRLPFRGRPMTVDGRIELDDARVRVPDWDLSLDALNGAVSFDRFGVRASGVHGRFHGAPLVLSAETLDGPPGTRIRVRADARQVPLSALHHHVPGTEFLTGSGSLTVTANLPGFTGDRPAEYPVDLQFSSDLYGVENTMPAPLGKAASEDVPLSVQFGVGERIGPVHVRYGKRASLQLGLAEQGGGLERLGVRFGDAEAMLPLESGIALTGKTAELDVDGWQAWSLNRGSDDSPEGQAIALRWLDIEAGLLRIGGFELPDVAVQGERGEDLSLALDGPTVAGVMRIPTSSSREATLRADLRYLRLSSWPLPGLPGEAGSSRAQPGLTAKPSDVPRVDIDISELFLMERELGHLRIEGEPDLAGNYQLREFALAGAAHTFELSGRWRVPEGTDLWFSLHSDDVGRMLSDWGHPKALRGGRGRTHGSLSWPGSPMNASAETLLGELKLDLRDGRLMQVEPGAGRLLGLVSVAMLPRRLLLNFSDVIDEGFAFDRLEADIVMAGGRATPRTLYMDGPAARISAEGDIDLVARTYDQTVTVVPKASATLPLIGGLIGGPPAAAALFVAQQLFSKGVDGVARTTYQLTGPWDRPVIERGSRSQPETTLPGEPGSSPSGP